MGGHTYWRARCYALRTKEVFTTEHDHRRMPNTIDLSTCEASNWKEKFEQTSRKEFRKHKQNIFVK